MPTLLEVLPLENAPTSDGRRRSWPVSTIAAITMLMGCIYTLTMPVSVLGARASGIFTNDPAVIARENAKRNAGLILELITIPMGLAMVLAGCGLILRAPCGAPQAFFSFFTLLYPGVAAEFRARR